MVETSLSFAAFDEYVEKAVQDGVFAGANFFARNKSGTLNYTKAIGKQSLAKDSDGKPFELNTVMSIASATKLITTISALQLVEQGLIALDDDVTGIIPELGDQPVLRDVDVETGVAITKPRENKLTLRHLLTHSAGAAYPLMNPTIDAWRKSKNLPLGAGSTFATRITQPLAYEPGTSWEYGTSIDWAGKIVEKLSNLSLDDYFAKNICAPLGISRLTFWPDKHSKIAKNELAKMTIRSGHPGPDGPVVDYRGPLITDNLEDCFGGHGGFADLSEYIEVLYSILVDDERLLKKETTAQMFVGQLEAEAARQRLSAEIGNDQSLYIGEFPAGEYDWGLGGVLIKSALPGWRKEDTLIWSGLPNIFWFIDRKAGTCGIFGTQVMPPGDKKVEIEPKEEQPILQPNSQDYGAKAAAAQAYQQQQAAEAQQPEEGGEAQDFPQPAEGATGDF